MHRKCTCHIVPKDVLDRLAGDARLPDSVRQSAAYSARPRPPPRAPSRT